ncbi:Phloem protein 2 [Quillaja saponaria]|uniref:Phloem protein 2 n=1 Tax=Quillaja saponaria TaxID=32244 RepID=A0AAD7M3I9_QUISA|nr:Phloem protein 2 [Quillaja saponaria]
MQTPRVLYQFPIKYPQNGQGGFMIFPRGLTIIWGNDSRYWRIPKETDPNPEAELIQVSWVEVTGKVPVKAGKKYEISFDVALKSDAFGWNGSQVLVMAKIGKGGKYSHKSAALDAPTRTPNQKFQVPVPKLEISVPENTENPELYFGLYDVWNWKWKGGLVIYNAVVKEI